MKPRIKRLYSLLSESERKVFEVVVEMCRGEPGRRIPFSEVVVRTGVAKSTVHNVLRLMAAAGLIEKDGRHYICRALP